MPDQTSTQVIITHLTYLREGFDDLRAEQAKTNAHLEQLNGRTRATEQGLAKLEGRAEEAEKSAASAKTSAIKWGAGAAAFLAGLAELAKAFTITQK